MEEERQAIIQKDNKILLEKMAQIMSTKGRLDNRNEYQKKRSVQCSTKRGGGGGGGGGGGARVDPSLNSFTKLEQNYETERAHQNHAREPCDIEKDSPRRDLT